MADIVVIIPVYNAEKYLNRTVQSVLNQPNAVKRIVLINDGSTDASAKICDGFTQSYECISVIHQMNCGVSAARNRGINFLIESGLSENDYIAFLDADDYWYPGYLSDSLITHIDQTRYDLYAFGMVSCNDKVECFSQPSVYESMCVEKGEQAIWKVKNHFAANLYRAVLFSEWNIRFLEGCAYSEDKFFKMQCTYLAKTIEFLPNIHYIYREARNGAMDKSAKITPKNYYLPIVNGWLQSDEFINAWAPVTGRTIGAGYTLASVYLLDMAREHYMQWLPDKEIRQAVEDHPHYIQLKALKAINSDDKNYKDKELFVNHPALFAWKYRLIGIVYHSLRAMLRIPFIGTLNEKRKFPLNKLP